MSWQRLRMGEDVFIEDGTMVGLRRVDEDSAWISVSSPHIATPVVRLNPEFIDFEAAADMIEVIKRATWGDEACSEWLRTRSRYGITPSDALAGKRENSEAVGGLIENGIQR